MQHEHKILGAIIEDRKALDMINEFIEDADFTAQGWLIVRYVRKYYEDKAADRVDTGTLIDQIGRDLGNAKSLEAFREIITNLPTGIGPATIAGEVLEHKREAASLRLENALATRSGADFARIRELLEEYTHIHDAADLESVVAFEDYAPDTYQMFTETLSNNNKIKIAPPALNDRLDGGALPGQTIVLFGRVEMGKSLAAINATVGFMAQGKRVLVIDNEDPLVETRRRIIQRLLRKPKEWIDANPREAADTAEEKGLGRLNLIDSPETAKDVMAAIKQFKPDVCVINQVWNMVQGDNKTSGLSDLAHSLRRIGKKTGTLMFLVTAAKEGDVMRDGQIQAKHILQTGDVYSSKTGIPRAADLLIGWGGSDDLMQKEMACISICKNKLKDGKSGRQQHFYVSVDPHTGVVYNGETQ